VRERGPAIGKGGVRDDRRQGAGFCRPISLGPPATRAYSSKLACQGSRRLSGRTRSPHPPPLTGSKRSEPPEFGGRCEERRSMGARSAGRGLHQKNRQLLVLKRSQCYTFFSRGLNPDAQMTGYGLDDGHMERRDKCRRERFNGQAKAKRIFYLNRR
jgi:hypothetical protein